MFGIFDKSLKREAFKLHYQNSNSIAYLSEVLGDRFPLLLLSAHKRVAENFRPGDKMSKEDLEDSIEVNRNLRRIYDELSLRPYLKKFDDEYTPLGGWKGAFDQLGI